MQKMENYAPAWESMKATANRETEQAAGQFPEMALNFRASAEEFCKLPEPKNLNEVFSRESALSMLLQPINFARDNRMIDTLLVRRFAQ